jgi:hypothetical protein
VQSTKAGYTVPERLILLGTPLVLAILLMFHTGFYGSLFPSGSVNPSGFPAVSANPQWWLTLHFITLPLFGLLGVTTYLLTKSGRGVAVTITRATAWSFIVFYTALDAIAGISVGIVVLNAQSLPASQQAVALQAASNLFSSSYIAIPGFVGSISWVATVFAATWVLRKNGAPILTLVLLPISALFFLFDHGPPTGPIGMVLFFIGVLTLELRSRAKG